MTKVVNGNSNCSVKERQHQINENKDIYTIQFIPNFTKLNYLTQGYVTGCYSSAICGDVSFQISLYI